MFKLITLLLIMSLSGCTEQQRFALRLNAQLDACAMKRMSETKISGQQGYLQAHSECHQILNFDKGHALHLESIDVSTLNKKDALEEHKFCWEFVKNLAIDKNFPDLRLVDSETLDKSEIKASENEGGLVAHARRRGGKRKLTGSEKNENALTLHLRERVFPNKLAKLDKEALLMVRDTIQSGSVIGHETLCGIGDYHELGEIIGKEVHRRYPYGVETTTVGRF